MASKLMSQDSNRSCLLIECGAMQPYFMQGMKLLLQILLLATFLHFFGLPAIEKYQKKEVMVLETSKDTDGIPLPAITLLFAYDAPENQKYRSCYHLNVSIQDCLKTNTHNVSDILKKIVLGFQKKETLVLDENEMIGDLAASRSGRIFTLKLPLKIGPNDGETQFFLFLEPKFVTVMLHDSNFFILNDNPKGLPTVTTVFDAATMFSHYHRIALTEIEELDVPTDPCNNDQNYNFNSCVRRSLARQVKQCTQLTGSGEGSKTPS